MLLVQLFLWKKQLWNRIAVRGGVKNRVEEESNRRPGYFGFRMQFPATYNREFFTTSDQDRQTWISNIRDMTEVRKIEDYYDIREMIGKGNFAEVYRVKVYNWIHY